MEEKRFFRLGIASVAGFWFMIYVLWSWILPLTTEPVSTIEQILTIPLMLVCVFIAATFLFIAMFCLTTLEPHGGSVI